MASNEGRPTQYQAIKDSIQTLRWHGRCEYSLEMYELEIMLIDLRRGRKVNYRQRTRPRLQRGRYVWR